METERSCDRTVELAKASLSEETTRRSCSPEERDQLADVATEITVNATPEPSVSSLICSGLQTLHGAEQLPEEHAWEESYELAGQPEGSDGCENGEVASHVTLEHDQVSPQLEAYPVSVVSS